MHQVLELTNDVKKHKGTILGKLNGKAVCLPKDTRMNRNIAVYGASGSMKSRAFARNMIPRGKPHHHRSKIGIVRKYSHLP